MSPTLQDLGIDQLSLKDRLTLAEAIWESVAAEQAAAPLSEAKRRELACRVADADANPDDVVPWEVVQAQALARAKK